MADVKGIPEQLGSVIMRQFRQLLINLRQTYRKRNFTCKMNKSNSFINKRNAIENIDSSSSLIFLSIAALELCFPLAEHCFSLRKSRPVQRFDWPLRLQKRIDRGPRYKILRVPKRKTSSG